jgi:RNA polymerase primary sigma factor
MGRHRCLPALRLILLRGMREGSVPDMSIEDIAEILDIEREHDLAPHLRRILGDIGAETDERFEYVDPDDNFKVHVEQEATEQEEDLASDAITRLDAIVSRRHEPIRQYLRSIQRHPLLSAAEELQLGQAMDSCLQQAIDLVATDGVAVRHVLDAIRHVQIGARRLGAISRGWSEPLETATDAAAEEEEEEQHAVIAASLVRPADQEADPDDDVDGLDSEEGARLDSIVQSLAKHLSTATSSFAEEELREILSSLRLSAGFLFELADANDGWQSTTSKMAFHAAMQRYRQAHDRMTTSNLKLVFSIAKKYVYSGLPLEDLVQEGNLGLIKAVERYDWRRGFRFSTFATWWIRQQIGRSVADSGRAVRLPVHMHEKVQSLRWMIRKYEAAHGETPSLATMSEAIGMRVDKVAPLLTYMEDILAIDSVDVDRLADPGFIARFHSAEPEDVAMRNEDALKVVKLLASLPRNQQNILRLRYGIGVRDALTLEEVGQGIGVTRERIRQIESKTLRMLQDPKRIAWLDEIGGLAHARPADQQTSMKPRNVESQGACSGQDRRSEDADLQQASESTETYEPKPQASPLEKALSLARELGISIEDQRSNGTGHLWVLITSFSDVASYRLIKQLRILGFQEAAGKGYWK